LTFFIGYCSIFRRESVHFRDSIKLQTGIPVSKVLVKQL